MIKENQKIFNQLHVLSDGLIVFLAFPVGFYIRFYVFSGTISVPLYDYIAIALPYTVMQLFVYSALGLYQSYRKARFWAEIRRLLTGSALVMAALLGILFLRNDMNFSRWALFFALAVYTGGLAAKRYVMRKFLRMSRRKGYNQKQVLLVGGGKLAQKYLHEIERDRSLGYVAVGYLSDQEEDNGLPWLGGFDRLGDKLDELRPDETVAAMEPEDFQHIPEVISACERAGVRLSVIPFYADYMSSSPQFDDLNGIPMLNIRRVPLDNWMSAFLKRTADVAGSALLLLLVSPVMLLCAVGVKLSSPGPVIFRQQRVGRGGREFCIYKFRSMRVNSRERVGWSTNDDDRKTAFGALMRKFSLDELPQLWNVLKGDMSLVGPRPEVPYYVERFREEIPLYMVKHQVRPGVTGLAQVNGLRGDTSIEERIRYDIDYIEHWSLWLDVKILLMTVFGGKFINSEEVVRKKNGPQ